MGLANTVPYILYQEIEAVYGNMNSEKGPVLVCQRSESL